MPLLRGWLYHVEETERKHRIRPGENCPLIVHLPVVTKAITIGISDNNRLDVHSRHRSYQCASVLRYVQAFPTNSA